ncbi:hypothetical protein [Nitrosomonas sp.]
MPQLAGTRLTRETLPREATEVAGKPSAVNVMPGPKPGISRYRKQ